MNRILVVIALVFIYPTTSAQWNKKPYFKLTADELKDNTYILVKGDLRGFLEEYQPLSDDGLGARFIFPRFVGGKPIITSDDSEIRFHSKLSEAYTLSRSFKVKEMIYGGKLEY